MILVTIMDLKKALSEYKTFDFTLGGSLSTDETKYHAVDGKTNYKGMDNPIIRVTQEF